MDDATGDPGREEIESGSTVVPDAGELAERLDAVEQLLGKLIERTATELRTRRLVVTEDDGFERVVIDASGSHGEVTVSARPGSAGPAAVDLYAHDASDGDGANVGVALVDQGNVVRSFDVFAHAAHHD
jgi:hypothetical protein